MSGGTLDSLCIFSISSTGLLPSSDCLSRQVRLYILYVMSVRNPIVNYGLASFPFARRYLGNRCFFLFLRVLRCFSSPGYLLYDYIFIIGYLSITLSGFPHSDICGSTDVCSFPQLFAACHVLHRLLVPRHSPYALIRLTIKLTCLALNRIFYC